MVNADDDPAGVRVAGCRPAPCSSITDPVTGAVARRPGEGQQHQPVGAEHDHARRHRPQRGPAGDRRRRPLARVPHHGAAAPPARPERALARQPGDRPRDVPQPVARPAAQQLRREGHRRDRRPAAQVGPPARGRLALHPGGRPARRPNAVRESVRLGPETLVDVLPDGRRSPALLRLETIVGDDAIGSISDDTYIGADNVDPELRTGLQSLRNVEEISIVAVPRSGQRRPAAGRDRPLRADALPLRRARQRRPSRTTRSATCRASASSSTPSTPRSTTRG